MKYVMHMIVREQDEMTGKWKDYTICPDITKRGTRIYIQDAIDNFRAVHCEVCLPEPDKIAHDIMMVKEDVAAE